MTVTAYHQGYVLDASVAAKWFVKEGETDRELALSIRQRHVVGRCRLIVPEFGLLEISNAIRYSPRAKEADGAAAVYSRYWALQRVYSAYAAAFMAYLSA